MRGSFAVLTGITILVAGCVPFGVEVNDSGDGAALLGSEAKGGVPGKPKITPAPTLAPTPMATATPRPIVTPVPTAVPTGAPTASPVAQIGPVSLFSSSTVPSSVIDYNVSIELGVKFRSDISGFITGIRFYKPASSTGVHTGTLWSSSGSRLATTTFTTETASGWQTAHLSSAVPIAANTVYVASYHTDSTYAHQLNYFTSSGVDSGVLHAPSSPAAGGNGVYVAGGGGVFPTQTYEGNNYFADVVFSTSSMIPATPRPIVTPAPTVAPTAVPTAVPTVAPGVTACTLNLNPTMNLSSAIQAIPNQSQTTVICLADGDYSQNVAINGKTNLVLRGSRAARLIEPNANTSTTATYYGSTVTVSSSSNIVFEGLQIINIHTYDPAVFHKVTTAASVNSSTNVTFRNVRVSGSGKNPMVASGSTVKILGSEMDAFYFVLNAINGADIFTDGGTFTHIQGDGHAFFWVSGGAKIYFRNPTFVFREYSGFTGVGGDATLKNVIIVDNPTVVNTTTGSLRNMANQHPNYDNLELYWLGPVPTTLRYDPANHYFGAFWFDPYVDVTRGTGPSYHVKYCNGAAAATSVQCTSCVSAPGAYARAFSTEAEYQQYFANDCTVFTEALPAGFRRTN